MMQLADKKRCFLVDLEDVPSEEIELMLAYYDMKATNQKNADRNAAISANLASKM